MKMPNIRNSAYASLNQLCQEHSIDYSAPLELLPGEYAKRLSQPGRLLALEPGRWQTIYNAPGIN